MFWRWSLKRWMSQGCVSLSPCVKNRFYAKTPSLQLPPSWFDPNNNFQKWSGKSIECTSAMIRSKVSHWQNQFSLVPIWSSMIQRELRGLSKKARDWPLFSISQTHSWLAWKDHRGYKSTPGRTNLWSFIDVHCAARGRGLHVLLIFAGRTFREKIWFWAFPLFL